MGLERILTKNAGVIAIIINKIDDIDLDNIIRTVKETQGTEILKRISEAITRVLGGK